MPSLKSVGKKVIGGSGSPYYKPSLKATTKKVIGGSGSSYYDPSLKSAGKKLIKGQTMSMQDVGRSISKRPRASIATTVEAGLGHVSAQQVYASRKILNPLTGTERGIVVNDPRLKVQSRGGGWARVTYTDPNAPAPITFSIRMNKISDVMHKQPNAWFHPAEAVYSKWINTTKKGADYSARRQVEGMLKVAIKRGDDEMARRLEEILKMSDDKVAAFRKDWEDSHTDEEIDDWYDYEEEEVW